MQSASAFERATALRPDQGTPGRFLGAIPDGWQQGKGAFGGVVIAALVRAILASEPDPARRLRSLTADLCAPALPVATVIDVTTLRRGGSVSFLEARLHQEGGLVARASAALAEGRAIPPARLSPPSPARGAPRWSDVPVIPVAPPLGPVFAQNFEYRSTGPLPFVGGSEAAAEGWLRAREEGAVLDEAAIAGLLDAWWPTVFATESAPRAVATIQFTMELFADPRSLPPGEPLFYRARGVAGGASFFLETRELWSGDVPVAMNQQTFALLS